MNLKAFEKLLPGSKTYIITILGIIYGVLIMGYKQHHWTSFGGAWTWVFSASGLAAFRAALAVFASNVIATLRNQATTTVGIPNITTTTVNTPGTTNTVTFSNPPTVQPSVGQVSNQDVLPNSPSDPPTPATQA